MLHARVSVVVFGDSMKNAATHPGDETVALMFTINIKQPNMGESAARRHHVLQVAFKIIGF